MLLGAHFMKKLIAWSSESAGSPRVPCGSSSLGPTHGGFGRRWTPKKARTPRTWDQPIQRKSYIMYHVYYIMVYHVYHV